MKKKSLFFGDERLTDRKQTLFHFFFFHFTVCAMYRGHLTETQLWSARWRLNKVKVP